MKRCLIWVIVALALTGAIAACLVLQPARVVGLQVAYTSWTGEAEHGFNEHATVYTVKAGDAFVLDGSVERLEVTVAKITDDSVTLKTDMPMSNCEAPFIDLATDKTSFVLSSGKPLRLVTPTMDAGDIYEISLLENE